MFKIHPLCQINPQTKSRQKKIPQQPENSATKQRQADFGRESKLGATDWHGMNSFFITDSMMVTATAVPKTHRNV